MIRIKVSATSANLGAAFDLAGMAFKLYNEFTFEKISEGLEFVKLDKYSNEDNLVYKAFKFVVDHYNLEMIGLRIGITANIPVSRGLGSSASLIVAGIVAANYFYHLDLSLEKMLDFATSIEGHPDNVAPALLGGLVLSFNSELLRVKPSKNLNYYVYSPDYELSTECSRKLVRQDFDLKEVINQMACCSFMVEGLRTGNMNLLRAANLDLIHEPGRSSIVEELQMLKKEYQDSYVVLSGAGSSILIIDDKELSFSLNVRKLEVNNEGYILEEVE